MRKLAIAAVLSLTLFGATGTPAAGRPSDVDTVDTVLEWFDTTAATVATATRPQVTNSRIWAISWLAAARALRATASGAGRRHYQHAALTSAAHEALATLVPERAAELAAARDTALARIPAGRAKDRGVAAGREEAQALLADRAGDGLDPASINAPYTPGAPAPTVWQPTPPAFAAAAQAGTRLARPFLLAAADQFRAPPPPAPGSQRYRDDLTEVRDYGAVGSTVRTAAQTETAQFWFGSSLLLYDAVLRAVLEHAHASRQPLLRRVELVAVFHVVLVDTQIATSDTKYAYHWWRPVTALRAADTGDATVPGDPNWTPLHTTPAHPDYPSGHNTYSGAAEGVLTAFFGPRARAPFAITSPSAPGVTRTYTAWHALTAENVDARVWSGIHTRSADVAGVRLGRQVAAHGLRHVSLLFTG